MSTLRVWRLGSAEHKVLPTQEAVDRLAEMLRNRPGGEDLDIVWDPFIDVVSVSGEGDVDIVTGPGIRVTREGTVVRVEREPGDAR